MLKYDSNKKEKKIGRERERERDRERERETERERERIDNGLFITLIQRF